LDIAGLQPFNNIPTNNLGFNSARYLNLVGSPTFYFPTNAHNVKKREVIKTF